MFYIFVPVVDPRWCHWGLGSTEGRHVQQGRHTSKDEEVSFFIKLIF